jgi:diguanylate cyclase (GGDEF)-like protein
MVLHNNSVTVLPLAKRIGRGCQTFGAYLLEVARRRSLIGEILALQLVFAVAVGALALAGLWWASTAVLEESAHKWVEQWLGNLDELGVPLYVSDDTEGYRTIESYVGTVAEIFFVRYYSASGEPIYTELARGIDPEIPPVAPETLAAIASQPADQQRYRVDTLFQETPIVRISKPIWTRAVVADGLLGVDLAAAPVNETLVGYVELGIDLSNYQSELKQTMTNAIIIGAAVLVLLTAASWVIYRRALLPISHLQHPLKMLAGGSTNFSVTTSGHREIVAIADALNATVAALKERDSKLRQLANHDALTGLINRHRFSELLDAEIEATVDEKRTSALLFIDLDQFKYMNDSFGHAAGDRLLKLVAERLVASVRERDIVARFGGDEFIVLLMDVSRKEVESICTTLVKRMQDERFIEGSESFDVRCSIGVTLIRSARITAEELLAQADMACHHAKAKGRNQFCVYKASDKEMKEIAAAGGWSQHIQRALKEDRFLLEFQPIVNIKTREITYYEVLLRLLVDEERVVLPSNFLPAAVRFGLMLEIDQWVIRNALRCLAEFRADHGDVRLAVNVSGGSIERPEFFKYIEEQAAGNNVSLDSLVIEITEQAAVRNMPAAARQISDFVGRGCKFAIDDFGAGYSSYSYLKTLPVALVKIDGSFVTNVVSDAIDQRIVSAISQIAKAARTKTIAEHVNDYETFVLLGELGVDYAQGNLLGKPAATLKPSVLPMLFADEAERILGSL